MISGVLKELYVLSKRIQVFTSAVVVVSLVLVLVVVATVVVVLVVLGPVVVAGH